MESIEELKQSIVDILKIELQNDKEFSEEMLAMKVELVIEEAIEKRGFGEIHSEETILKYLVSKKSSLSRVALFDYNQIGAEAEERHIENDIDRTWNNRDKLWSFITPLARLSK